MFYMVEGKVSEAGGEKTVYCQFQICNTPLGNLFIFIPFNEDQTMVVTLDTFSTSNTFLCAADIFRCEASL